MKRDLEYDCNRYRGKPLLAILDQFVLSVALPPTPEQITVLNQAVEKIWGESGEWETMIIKHMGFGNDILMSLKGMWESNQNIAKTNGVSLTPWQFAKMVTDTNFAKHIDQIK